MGKQRRILLYGNSVILGGLGASLERAGKFEVIHLSPPLPGRAKLEAGSAWTERS